MKNIVRKLQVKRVFAILVALTMILTWIPDTKAYADGGSDPVISAVKHISPEVGTVLHQFDTIQFNVTVSDEDDDLDFANAYIQVYFESEDSWDWWYSTTYEELGENQYAFYFPVERDMNASFVIEKLGIYDNEGNKDYVDVLDGNGEQYTFTLEERVNHDYTLTGISLSTDRMELTDDILSRTLTYTLEVDGLLPDTNYEFRFCYENEEEREYYMYAYYDAETGVCAGEENWDYSMDAGHYTLTKIWCNDERIDIAEGVTSEFDFVKNNTDKTAPALLDVGFYLNGEVMESGAIVTDTDELKVFVKLDDDGDSELNSTIANIIYYASQFLWFEYDESAGMYIADIDVSQLTACEWSLDYLHIYDKYQNESYLNGDTDEKFLAQYFYVQRDGNCEIRTFSFNVYINDEYYTHVENISRVTTLNTIFNGNIPATEKEGYEFIGWCYDDKLVDLDTLIRVSDRAMYLEPVYDILDITVGISYFNKDGHRTTDSIDLKVPYGTSYAELIKTINLDAYEHWNGVNMLGWDINGYTEIPDIKLEYDQYIDISAMYDKDLATLVLEYYDDDMNHQELEIAVAGTNGSTWGEALKNVTWPELDHADVLEFAGAWDTSEFEDAVFYANDFLWANAIYNKTCIEVIYFYYNEDLEFSREETSILVDADSTYGDIIAGLEIEADHSTELGFSGWYAYIADEMLGMCPWGVEGLELHAEYENMLIYLELEYIDKDGDYYNSTQVMAIPYGTTYGSLGELLGDIEHFEALGFTGNWILDVEESQLEEEIEAGSFIAASAEYAKAYVVLDTIYFGKGLRERYKEIGVAVEPGTTFAEAIAQIEDAIIHDEALHFAGWETDVEGILDEKCEVGINNIRLYATYEEKILQTFMTYYDEEYYLEYEEQGFIVPEGATYNDMIDVIAATVTHPEVCGKVTWDIMEWSEEELQQVVTDSVSYIMMEAVYEKYPIILSYTYLDKNDTPVFVEEELVVDAGTTKLDILTDIKLPEDAKEVTYWVGNSYCSLEEEIYLGESRWSVAAGYEGYTVFETDITVIDEDNFFDWVTRFVYISDEEYENINSSGDEEKVVVKRVNELGLENKNAFKLLGYEVIDFFPGDQPDDNYLYYYADSYSIVAKYDKAVINFIYPDGKEESLVVDVDSEYTLPETYRGYEVTWGISSMDSYDEYEGGEKITISSPGVYAYAFLVEDIELEPEEDIEDTEDTEDEVVVLDPEEIEEEVKKIEDAKEEETIIIDMKKDDDSVATEVPVEILEAAQGKDIEIVLDMGDYSWTINGKDIASEELEAINLEVSLDADAIDDAVIKEVAKDKPVQQISLTHDGDFGFEAKLTVNLGAEHKGEYGNLYYYNADGKLVFMNAGLIDENGNVSLNFSHASDYVIVIGEEVVEENIPDKGDVSTGASMLVLFAGCALVLACIYGKKKLA